MGHENWKPEPAESFEIDFLNTKHIEATNAMSKLGGFIFNRGSSQDGLVYFEGQRSDGTTIKIEFKKGENYKTPKEISDQMAEKK
jgi:hypothetical protein